VTRYAETEVDAEQRYNRYRDIDPFLDIDAALLNSAHISDYVAATGMIVPFVEDDKHLKSASYGVALRGRCIYWDGNGEKKDFILSDVPIEGYEDIPHQRSIALDRNSIAFVTLEPTFRLPEYIALRFNLTIREVYRGLLLGTGPLVDPGFKGKLSFPLHNLTDNAYNLQAGEEIVWVEFTKVSRLPRWRASTPTTNAQLGTFFGFPPRKLERKDVADYLNHAWSAPIRVCTHIGY
jgi:deoxycytidine triphosphate deaminase